jgi:hypothetical protein
MYIYSFRMLIFSNLFRSLHSYKPKICFCNLSGLQEIWVTSRIITKSKDQILCYLRKKLNDNTITNIIIDTVGQNYIIRCPQRKLILNGYVWDPKEYPILGDDIDFIHKYIHRIAYNRHGIHNDNLYKWYGAISPRINTGKIRQNIIKYIIYNMDFYITDCDLNNSYLYIQEHILTNIHIILEYMYTEFESYYHWIYIYIIISDKFKSNPIIIDMVLGADYDDYFNAIEDIINTIPNELLTYDFVVNNLNNISISRLYQHFDLNSILLSNQYLIVIAVKYDNSVCGDVFETVVLNELDTKDNILLILNSCEYTEIINIENQLDLTDPDIQAAILECKKR